MEIITNNHERTFKYDYEVPESVLNDFDHLDDDQKIDGWIHYRNRWYHITDFMRVGYNPHFKEWSGYTSDSFFSGVLIRFCKDDAEVYKIATYLS